MKQNNKQKSGKHLPLPAIGQQRNEKQSIFKWVRNIFIAVTSHINFFIFLVSTNDSKSCSFKR